jgi:glutaminyl-peptide cyclotransferase
MIFFDGEEAIVEWTDEDSIYGARHLASKWSNEIILVQNDDGSTAQINPLNQIDALVLLDLLGKRDAVIPNSHPETQWLWDRLTRIHERLGILKMVSEFMAERIKRGDYMFQPGMPTISATAIQV